jgi:DNA-binding NarL/FixJ family response regulator
MIRVAIVADSSRLRSELGDVLRESGRVEVVAAVSSFDEDPSRDVEPFISNERDFLNAADVIVADGAVATGFARAAERGGAGLVLLSDEDELLATLRPLRTGIALLPLTAPAEQIVAAVEAVAAGLLVLHEDHAGPLSARPADDPLTPREREVLHMLAAGLGNKEIATRLRISDHTAKFHVSQILAKLDAVSRAEAVSIAMRRGLVPL